MEVNSCQLREDNIRKDVKCDPYDVKHNELDGKDVKSTSDKTERVGKSVQECHEKRHKING